MAKSKRIARFERACLGGILLLLTLPTAGKGSVPWVDGHMQPSSFGRMPLTKKQEADAQFDKGRRYFDKARALEAKAASASNDGKRQRYLESAFDRYRASADAYAASLRRARSENITPDYLPVLYLEMGDALHKTRQHEEAAAAYRKAVELAPAFFQAQFGYARTQLIVGELDGVRKGFEWLRLEAQIKPEAWTAIDQLMAMIEQWLPLGQTRWQHVSTSEQTAFRAWYEQTRDELKDEVRWSVIEQSKE